MFPLSSFRLARGLKGKLLAPGGTRDYARVSTDTRTLKAGDVFVALKGPRYDGTKFFDKALKAGAAALVGTSGFPGSERKAALVKVGDPLRALQDLALDQRLLFEHPVVAITGSNGKTSTKECLAWLLGGRDLVLSTPGNWNNHVGLPLTLLGLERHHRFAVLELGMNHFGELSRLARICRPDVSMVLNVGDAHLEYFGTRRNVAKAKEELLQGTGSQGCAVINGDDPLVAGMGERFKGRVLSFGSGRRCELRLLALRDSGAAGLRAKISWMDKTHAFALKQGGRVRLAQAMASLAACLALGKEMGPLLQRLEAFEPAAKNRQQLKKIGGATYILDMYNASPQSMAAGLELLEASAPTGRRVALLGDMLELGLAAPRFHYMAGREARARGVSALAALGPNAKETLRGFGGTGKAFATTEVALAAQWLKEQVKAGDWVLLKGSRGMALERVLDPKVGG